MKRRLLSTIAALATTFVLFTGCSAVSTDAATTTTVATATAAAATVTTDSSATSSDFDWDSLPSTEVTLTDKGLTITEAGTYILSGSTTGQIVVDTDGDVRIILNGVTIASSTGAAIQVNNADNTVIELAEGTTNKVSDAATRSDESIDAAIYSADDLFITGEGTLTFTASFADGIAGKDDLTIESGTINVTSADDGVTGKDSLVVTGGTLTVDAAQDGLKATNDADAGEGQLVIAGGTVTITSGDQAIKGSSQLRV